MGRCSIPTGVTLSVSSFLWMLLTLEPFCGWVWWCFVWFCVLFAVWFVFVFAPVREATGGLALGVGSCIDYLGCLTTLVRSYVSLVSPCFTVSLGLQFSCLWCVVVGLVVVGVWLFLLGEGEFEPIEFSAASRFSLLH